MNTAQAVTSRNLVLTGFMGTGKTTIGKMLATELGWPFIDSDALIVQRFGPVEEIFDSHGEDHFRSLEREVAKELAKKGGHVIATGGALVLDPLSAAVLNATGRTFCLVARPRTIFTRLGGDSGQKRPLLAGGDPESRIRDLLTERSAGYGAFPQVSTETSTMANIASELADLVATEPEHQLGPNGGNWWIGAGLMGAAAQLAGHRGAVIAVVDQQSKRYGPVTGATQIIEISGSGQLEDLRRSITERDDGAVVVVVGDEQVLSMGVSAAESVGVPVVLCPSGARPVDDAIELGAASPTGHTIVLDLATMQSGDPEYVEPLAELWANVSARLTDLAS